MTSDAGDTPVLSPMYVSISSVASTARFSVEMPYRMSSRSRLSISIGIWNA